MIDSKRQGLRLVPQVAALLLALVCGASSAWAQTRYGFGVGAIEGTGGRCEKTTPSCTVIFVFDVAGFDEPVEFDNAVKLWESLPDGVRSMPVPTLAPWQKLVIERLKTLAKPYDFNKVYYYEVTLFPAPVEGYRYNDPKSIASARDAYLKRGVKDPRMMMVALPGLWAGRAVTQASSVGAKKPGSSSAAADAWALMSETPGASSGAQVADAQAAGLGTAQTNSTAAPGSARDTGAMREERHKAARRAADALSDQPNSSYRADRLEVVTMAETEEWGCAFGEAWIDSDEGVSKDGRTAHFVQTRYDCKCYEENWKGKTAQMCLTSYQRGVVSLGRLKPLAAYRDSVGMRFTVTQDHRDPEALKQTLDEAWKAAGGTGRAPPILPPRQIIK